MKRNVLSAVTLLLATAPAIASAAVDLRATITQAATVPVYTTARFNVVVANIGNTNAAASGVTIQLPATATSPQVYVMGGLGAYGPTCTRSGTVLTCPLGALRKGRSVSTFVEIMLPQKAGPLTLTATATPTDSNPGNNVASINASLTNPDVVIAAPRIAKVRHCTGTNLTSFYECTLFPSSLSWHRIQFDPGSTPNSGTISFIDSSQGPIPPGSYTGTWSQPANNRLVMEYVEVGVGPSANHSGFGVSAGSCFEGMTTFPGSTYVSPYEVCLE